jgi:hypothetical protein
VLNSARSRAASRGVVFLLGGDRAGALGGGHGCDAEASSAVGGQDPHPARQRGEPLQGGVLGTGEFGDVLLAEQVWPARAADQQAAAGEHCGRAGSFADQPGDVLEGVPRRRHGGNPQVAEHHLVALVRAAVGELVPSPGGGDDLRAGAGADLVGAGDVVVVHVRFQHGPDRDPPGLGGPEEPPGVPLRIDDRRLITGHEQVAVVSQAPGHKHLDVHDHLPHALIFSI